DDRELVPARALLSRHYAIRGGGLRRPRNDAAGIVGVSAPAPAPSPATTPAAAIGFRAGGGKPNRAGGGEHGFAAPPCHSSAQMLVASYRSSRRRVRFIHGNSAAAWRLSIAGRPQLPFILPRYDPRSRSGRPSTESIREDFR